MNGSHHHFQKDSQSKSTKLGKNHKNKPVVICDTPIGQAMEIKEKEIPKNLKWSNDQFKKASAPVDFIDDIYAERDPIGASLKQRKSGESAMPVTTVIRTPASQQVKCFFYTLRLKGFGDHSTVTAKEVKSTSIVRKAA